MNNTPKEMNASNTVLGHDSEFEGDMKFFGTITIKGSFKGHISGEGTIIVEKNGNLISDVHATYISVHGQIHGQVSAENKIHIFSSGIIYGDIKAPDIQIEKGALIKGNCKTHKIDLPVEKDPPIIKTGRKKIIQL
ncbi:MAG: polymer-forming cytoskeletal protein [Desulfobacteraceae bacterium]|nr:polymer-forming cytoskeletal protein [Desulfobacteraceae bacterium]